MFIDIYYNKLNRQWQLSGACEAVPFSVGLRVTHVIISADFVLRLGGVGVFRTTAGWDTSPVVMYSCLCPWGGIKGSGLSPGLHRCWSRWISGSCGLPVSCCRMVSRGASGCETTCSVHSTGHSLLPLSLQPIAGVLGSRLPGRLSSVPPVCES